MFNDKQTTNHIDCKLQTFNNSIVKLMYTNYVCCGN